MSDINILDPISPIILTESLIFKEEVILYLPAGIYIALNPDAIASINA